MTGEPARHSAVAITRAYAGDAAAYAAFNADRSFAEPLLDLLAAALPPGGAVVDLGCGPGWETAALARRGLRALGLDLTRDFVAFAAREHPAAGCVQGDFLALPFADGALDGAWACSSLVHLPSARVDDALAEIRRVLRPGGAFFASMQAGATEGEIPSVSFPGKRYHYAFYDPADWRARLERAGFAVLSWNEHPGTTNPGATGWIESLVRRT